MIAVAILCGLLFAAGGVLLVVAFTNPVSTIPRLSTPVWMKAVDKRHKQRIAIVAAGVVVGLVTAIATGWWLLVVVIPVTLVVLPSLLSAPPNRELELLQAIDRWVRTLGSLLPTGRSISDAVRVSVRQAPALLAPHLRLLTARLDDRWTVEHALVAMADELDSPDADAVLAALALAAQRGGTGASGTLAALADNVQDRLRALREISTERAKPRFVVRQVTLITAVVLALALVFGGSFFAPFGTPLGQVLLAALISAYLGSLMVLRGMTLPRPRQRILRRTS